MKPLHIGLLVFGAAVAGGLAVKMTQPSSFSSQAPAAVSAPLPKPRVAVETAPAAVTSPDPAGEPAQPEAPPPVYTEPAQKRSVKVAPRAKSPVQLAQTSPAPAPYQAPEVFAVPTAPPVEQPRTPDPEPTPAAAAPAIPEPRRVTLNAGTNIPARVLQTLVSDKLRAGDTFQATLAEPLVVNDLVIAERGARVTGRVVDAAMAGKFQGVSKLELALSSFQSTDGQKVAISTTPWVKQAESNRNSDVAKIGGAAALGAIIGAIAGGGKGAAIGAGAGAGAGTGAVVLTPNKPITIPTETVIQFRLAAPVTITERI